MAKTHEIFDAPGPLMTDPKYGREPSLRELLYDYYIAHGIDAVKASRLTTEYIRKWRPISEK